MSSISPTQPGNNIYPNIANNGVKPSDPKIAELFAILDQKVSNESATQGLKKLFNSLFADKIQDVTSRVSENSVDIQVTLNQEYTKKLYDNNSELYLPKELHFTLSITPPNTGLRNSYESAELYFPDRKYAPREEETEKLIVKHSYHWNEVNCTKERCTIEYAHSISLLGFPKLSVGTPTPMLGGHDFDVFKY